jgi:large subunit ribosomal protein L4
MANINVIGKNGGRTIELELPTANPHVLHEVVTWQLAGKRRGTASTKTRAEVNRSGKKMYSQKGTGNARHGNRSVPNFVGGGVAFGPKPRSYRYSLPRKIRQLGLAMAIADRYDSGKLIAVDGFDIDSKTKSFVAWAKQRGLDGSAKVLVVTDDENVLRGARNIAWVSVIPSMGINAYDILRHDCLVLDATLLEPAEDPSKGALQ